MSANAGLALIGVCLSFVVCDGAVAREGKNCKQQKDEIVYEMEQAKRYGNLYKQRGLEYALYRVEHYCDDAEPSQREKELSRALTDVQRRQDQLEAAIEYGSPRRVEQSRKKLQQARERLHSLSEHRVE